MSAVLKKINVIPVYRGLSIEQSWIKIVNADNEPILPGPDSDSNPAVTGWANIGTWENSQGDSYTALVSDQGEPLEWT